MFDFNKRQINCYIVIILAFNNSYRNVTLPISYFTFLGIFTQSLKSIIHKTCDKNYPSLTEGGIDKIKKLYSKILFKSKAYL